MAGLFISLEGGEGTGKTTQIRLLREALAAQGRQVITTREPGGTAEAEKIRGLLVQRDGGAWTPMAECLLLFAARAMHVEQLIRPALMEGKIVITDRFTDSTRAYQGYGHGFDPVKIEALNALVLDGFAPAMTFILDLPVGRGLRRAAKRLETSGAQGATEDRFEQMKIDFHERMRQGYLAIANREPDRCRVIDAALTPQAMAEAILEHLQPVLALHV